MRKPRVPMLAKYLFGILLVQGLTALLVMTAQKTDLSAVWPMVVAVALLAGSLAALWFASLTHHISREALAKAGEKFNRKQANALKRAEKAKTREVNEAHRKAIRESKRSQRHTNLKLGTALAGVSLVSVGLLFTQFMTLGLLAATVVGGVLLGYGIRARQAPRLIEAKPAEKLSRLPDPVIKKSALENKPEAAVENRQSVE